MKTYKAVIFDLFDTLVDFDRARIPVVAVDGVTMRSTAGETYRVLARHATHLTFDVYYRLLSAVTKDLTTVRERDHLEIPPAGAMRCSSSACRCRATPLARRVSMRCWRRIIATCTTPRSAPPSARRC